MFFITKSLVAKIRAYSKSNFAFIGFTRFRVHRDFTSSVSPSMASRCAFHQGFESRSFITISRFSVSFSPLMKGIGEIAFRSTTRSPSIVDGGSGSGRRRREPCREGRGVIAIPTRSRFRLSWACECLDQLAELGLLVGLLPPIYI